MHNNRCYCFIYILHFYFSCINRRFFCSPDFSFIFIQHKNIKVISNFGDALHRVYSHIVKSHVKLGLFIEFRCGKCGWLCINERLTLYSIHNEYK